ncbi:MAG: class D beta-lactamase [Sphingobacteriales bacterium]|jgi:beta-lactamase class D
MRNWIVLASIWLLGSCTVNNVEEDDSLKVFFDEFNVDGTFAMFDNSRGQHVIYNLKRDTTRFMPASTFKIVNALIALQTGRITSDSSIIKWDGVVRDQADWNKDLTLAEAFNVSSVPHFQQLARSIGRDTMRAWLDSLSYGDEKMGPNIDSFWLDNSLKISADAQVWLVKMLYFKQLPFRASVQEQVKRMMIKENNTIYQLAYKTGWGKTDSGNELGWIIGWIEENRHVYFFAMNLESSDHTIDMKRVREKILKNILTKQGFFQGKM